MSAKIQLLQDRVLLKRLAAEDKTPAGLTIPASAQEKQSEGIVIAVGPGKAITGANIFKEALTVKVGDRVMFQKYASTVELKLDGEDHIIIREEDIIGILMPLEATP